MQSEKSKPRIRKKNKHFIATAERNDALRGMWLQCRLQDAAVGRNWLQKKRQAEQKAAYLATKKGDPNQSLRVLGHACRLHRDPIQHQQLENQTSLIPWNGDREVMIDRFDVRTHLPSYQEPEPIPLMKVSKEQAKEEAAINFERYRWLVQADQLQKSEHEVLSEVKRCIKATMDMEAELERELTGTQKPKLQAADAAASPTTYGAADASDSATEDEDEDDCEDEVALQALEKLQKEADALAMVEYGIVDFTAFREADEEQQRQEMAMRMSAPNYVRGRNPLPRWERLRLKRQHQKEKEMQRMAAQAAENQSKDLNRPDTAETQRSSRSPKHSDSDDYSNKRTWRSKGHRRSRYSRSRSPSPSHRRSSRGYSTGGVQFITSFSASRKDDTSSDDNPVDPAACDSPHAHGISGTSSKAVVDSKPKLTPAQKLKLRTQAMLNATLKKDLEKQQEKEEERRRVIEQYTKYDKDLQVHKPQQKMGQMSQVNLAPSQYTIGSSVYAGHQIHPFTQPVHQGDRPSDPDTMCPMAAKSKLPSKDFQKGYDKAVPKGRCSRSRSGSRERYLPRARYK